MYAQYVRSTMEVLNIADVAKDRRFPWAVSAPGLGAPAGGGLVGGDGSGAARAVPGPTKGRPAALSACRDGRPPPSVPLCSFVGLCTRTDGSHALVLG